MNERYLFNGLRAAVLGAGVSGLAAARILKKLGAYPTVFDQKPSDHPDVVRITDQLYQEDIAVVSGWHGRLDAERFDTMIVSPGFRRDHPAITDFGSKPVMSEVEFASRITDAPMVAVTGTNGKSTTTVLTWLFVNAMGKTGHLCGNIAGSGYPEKPLSVAAHEAKADEVLVAEVSSYQLEFVSKLRPMVSTVLNVTPDHMDRHPSFEDYFGTKMRLVENVGHGDVVVVNADEPSVSVMRFRSAMKNGAKVVSFSPTGQSVTQNETSRRSGDSVYLGSTLVKLSELSLYGEHNIANLMAAWELASAVTNGSCDPTKALHEFKGLEHRMELVGERSGIKVINNSMCTNPAALIASSTAIDRRQFLIVGGNMKRLDFSDVRRYFEKTNHEPLIVGANSDKLNQALGGMFRTFDDIRSAFTFAQSNAVQGEVILLCPGCASLEPYANFRERGDDFRSIAKEWINAENY